MLVGLLEPLGIVLSHQQGASAIIDRLAIDEYNKSKKAKEKKRKEK